MPVPYDHLRQWDNDHLWHPFTPMQAHCDENVPIIESGEVDQVLVIGWPDSEWGQKLVAFYVPSVAQSHERKWAEELRAALANYKIPKQMIQVPTLPLDERGKVDRKAMQRLIAKSERKLEG